MAQFDVHRNPGKSRREIERAGELLEIEVDGAALAAKRADAVPLGESEFSKMVNVEQLAGLSGGEVGAARAEKLQRVPFRGVMTCAD